MGLPAGRSGLASRNTGCPAAMALPMSVAPLPSMQSILAANDFISMRRIFLPSFIDNVGMDRLGVRAGQDIIPAAHPQRHERAVQHDVIEHLVLVRAQPAQVWQHATTEHMAAPAKAIVKDLASSDFGRWPFVRRRRGKLLFRKDRRQRYSATVESKGDDPPLIVAR